MRRCRKSITAKRVVKLDEDTTYRWLQSCQGVTEQIYVCYYRRIDVLSANTMLSWHLGESKTQDQRITQQRSGHTATLIGGLIFVIGGYEDIEGETLDICPYLVLNAMSHTWNVLYVDDDFALYFSDHTADLVDDKVFLLGGDDDQDLFNLSFSVVRIFDPTTEEVNCVLAHGVFPTARSRQVTEFFERKREIVMFGGKIADDTFVDELHALDVDRMTWVRLRAKGRGPPPQSSHMSTLCGSHMFILGIEDRKQALYVLTYELPLPVWSELRQQGSVPPSLYGGSMNYVDSKLVVFGGGRLEDMKDQKELYMYDITRQSWQVDEDGAGPAQRTDTFKVVGRRPGTSIRHKGVLVADKLLMIGGFPGECSKICELRFG